MNRTELKEELAWRLDRTWRNIRNPFWWLKRHLTKEHRELIKEAIKFEPWDWYYQLNLERAGLERMIAYHKKSKHVVGWERMVKEMELCVQLIEIIMGDVELTTGRPDYKFCRAFNENNMSRFASSAEIEYMERSNTPGLFQESIYITKAEHLYHKIRAERERTWWD